MSRAPVHDAAMARDEGGLASRLDAAEAACARAGTQLTELRRSVLGLILSSETPLTAYQLLDRLKETRAGAAPPTIYRALDFLIENRLIHRIQSLNAFVACAGHVHHHRPAQFLICRGCGRVAEIENRAVSTALARAAATQGFQLGAAVVEVAGLCADCARGSAENSTEAL